jgi:hypothetical protein
VEFTPTKYGSLARPDEGCPAHIGDIYGTENSEFLTFARRSLGQLIWRELSRAEEGFAHPLNGGKLDSEFFVIWGALAKEMREFSDAVEKRLSELKDTPGQYSG